MISDFKGFNDPIGRALSRGYGRLRHLDNMRKSRKPKVRPQIPTISIGNITVGGTGKTPMAIYLAEHFRNKNLRPVILTRGYSGYEKGPAQVLEPCDPARYGDEALLLARRGFDVWVAKYREQGVEAAQAAADVLILDDGFQRIEIERDIDIVMFHASGMGNGHLLPAGILRDAPRTLTRADAFCGPQEGIPSLFPAIPRFEFAYGNLHLDTPLPAGKKVAALAAIAHPRFFFQAVKKLPVALDQTFALPDHDPLTSSTLQRISDACVRSDIDTIIVTEKDSIKLDRGLGNLNVVTACADFRPVSAESEQAFWKFIWSRAGV